MIHGTEIVFPLTIKKHVVSRNGKITTVYSLIGGNRREVSMPFISKKLAEDFRKKLSKHCCINKYYKEGAKH